MKILITGGAGFIGSNIADALLKAKHKVIIFDNLSSGKKANINSKAKFYKADIFNKKSVDRIFKQEKPEIVIHNAAQIDVRKSVEDPYYDAEINILGSINVLQACKQNKTKKIIFASSGGTIYGECGKNPPDENTFPNPLSPYGIAKYSVERYIQFFAEIHGLKYTVLRYANVYGPRQDPKGEAGVVAIFARRMLLNQDVLVFGNGKQMRDYVFVNDVVNANLKALTKGNNKILNIGTQKTISVVDLIKLMSKVTDYKKKPVFKPARKGELFKSFLKTNNAKKYLNWKPLTDIKSGLEATIEYFEKMELK